MFDKLKKGLIFSEADHKCRGGQSKTKQRLPFFVGLTRDGAIRCELTKRCRFSWTV